VTRELATRRASEASGRTSEARSMFERSEFKKNTN